MSRRIISVLIAQIVLLTTVAAYPQAQIGFSQIKFDRLLSLLKRSEGQINPMGAVGNSLTLSEQADQIEYFCKGEKSQVVVRESLSREGRMLNVICQNANNERVLQVVATLNEKENQVLDLQVLDMRHSKAADSDQSERSGEGRIITNVVVGTLAAGLLATGFYPGQADKLKHALVGSVIVGAAVAIGYYGLHLTPNQSILLGVAAVVVAALLKEYAFDAKNKDKHTVDIKDAFATTLGTLAAMGISYTVVF